MSISNLLLSAPIANNGTQNVQGQNTLLVSNAAPTIFRILNTLTMTAGGSISITNSTVIVDGTNTIIAAYIDGNIWVNAGTFMVTNKITELGYVAQGSLTVSNGTTDIGALEIAENPGSAGTLTLAGGTNALDGYILVGNSLGATGTVWMTGGSMLATGSVTRVGNAGPGQMIVSNGAWASQELDVGSFAGANGTLTLVAGSVAAKGPLIIGGGTGTVVVGFYSELAITNVPTASFTALGFFICDGSALVTNGGTLLATNATTYIGEHGAGSFTNSGGVAKFQSLDVGVLSGSQGTLTMLGGATTVSQQMAVGGNVNATGTVWMLGGQYNGPMTVGSSGIGRVAMSNGTMNVNNLILGLAGVGTFTMAGGTNLSQDVNIGFSSATGQLWVTGGQIGTNGVDYTVGVGNVGGMTISNGIALGREMQVGLNSGSRGTLNVAGGTLALSGPLFVGGGGSTGLVQVTGGQLVLTNTPQSVGVGSGLIVDTSLVLSNGGTLMVTNVPAIVGNVDGGTLTNAGGFFSGPNITVGNLSGSHGVIMMSDGTIATSGSLTLGKSAGANGTLWMTGGALTAVNSGIAHIILGSAGQGALIVSNGTVRADQTFAGNGVGASGVLTIAGGSFLTDSTLELGGFPSGTGTVWVTSGVLALTNNFSSAEFFTHDGIAQLTVSNGQVIVDLALIASLSNVGQGTLTFAGGTTTVNTNLVLGNTCSKGKGNVVVNGGSLYVTNASHTAVLDVNNGVLELDSGTLVVDKLVMTNSCAQFVRTGGTLIYGSVLLDPTGDADGDGIPNGYEQSHGLDPLNPVNATLDSDGDGMTDLQEYLAGTDPTSSASAFRITSVTRTGNNVLVAWMMGPGKTNALQWTAGSGGSYATNSFANLFIVTNTVGTATNYLDVGGATNKPARYYRVRLVP
jgi:hypothetical protein